jgi:CheY-like chemotaxis protein
MKNHEGHIQVQSEVDVGTRVDLFVPASAETSQREAAPKKGPFRGEGRILLIDDEELIRRSAGELLRRFGYEVQVAGEGAEGIRCYSEALESGRPFDAVIMDLTIRGGQGGKETIEELLKVDPDARVIVSSGYSDDPVMSRFEEQGFRDVITKPYMIQEVARILKKVVSG